MARDTKLGPEEITRDIPNVSEEALKNLDEAGIVYIGAEVHAGRHPGRQDHAEGRKPDDAGREAAARHLRREGLRRARHLAARCRRACRARSSKCACSTATASTRTSARSRSSARRSSVSPRTATTSRRSSTATSTAGSAELLEGRTGDCRAEGLQEGHQDHQIGARGVSALAMVAVRLAERQADGRDRSHPQAVRREQEAPRAALPRQGREAAARRRAAARRDEDGQGLRRGEAQDPARRQDGRPPRQQGRGVEDRAGRGHAVPRGRHAGRHRAQSARRAEPHECRPDPGDPSRLGLRRPRQQIGQAVDAYNGKRRRQAAQGHAEEDLRRGRDDQVAARRASWSSSPATCATACRSRRRCSTAPRKPTSSTCSTSPASTIRGR